MTTQRLLFCAFTLISCHGALADSYSEQAYQWYERDLSKTLGCAEPLKDESEITPEMTASMKRFSELYPLGATRPNGQGFPDADYQKLIADVHAAFPWDPTAPGKRHKMILSGDVSKPDADGAKLMTTDGLRPLLERLLAAYARAKPEQTAELEDGYRRLIQCFLEAKYIAPTGMVGWLGNGYGWRNWGYKFLAMDHTLPPKEMQMIRDSLAYVSGGSSLYREHPRSSTDQQLNFYYIALKAIGRMPNGPVKWQRLQFFRRGLDLAVTEGNLITPDGGIVHHGGHHIAYASYSLTHILKHLQNLSDVGVIGPHSQACTMRFRNASEAWAFNSLQGEIPVPMQLRPQPTWEKDRGKGQFPGQAPGFAMQASRLTEALGGIKITQDKGMARVAGSKSRGNVEQVPAPWRELMNEEMMKPYSGHRPFPIMGMSVHRRDDWVVMVRGANRFFRGGEVYSDPNFPGGYMRRMMEGGLFVYSTGKEGRFPNAVDSGFRTEGYDPRWIPNVTTVHVDESRLTGGRNPAYMGSGAAQGGGTELLGHGTFAWSPGAVRKSVFMFDNRIVSVTGINEVKGGDVRTTLLQLVHDKLERSEGLVIDGEMFEGDVEKTLTSTTSHTLIDANRTGYYIPAGMPKVKVNRGMQSFTYAVKAMLKPGEDEAIMGQLKTQAQVIAAHGKFKPYERPASLAYLDHGANPKNQLCAYAALIRTTPQELAKFQQAMDSDDPSDSPMVVKFERSFHLCMDRATGIFGVTTFDPKALVKTKQVVEIGRPATMMWVTYNEGKSLAVSIASTDKDNREPFEITLKGDWAIAGSSAKDATTAKSGDGTTTLTVPYRNQLPRKVKLQATAG